MSDTYTGYTRKCKDTLGGIVKAYLLPYYEYDETQIKNNGMFLETFPFSQVYEFDVNGSFNQQSDIQSGNVSFTQNVVLEMSKVYTFYDVNTFVRNDFRVITFDNNGVYTIFGTNNGMVCKLSNASGNEKGEFSGFTLNFEGLEELSGLYVADFSKFFTISTFDFIFNYDLNFNIIG